MVWLLSTMTKLNAALNLHRRPHNWQRNSINRGEFKGAIRSWQGNAWLLHSWDNQHIFEGLYYHVRYLRLTSSHHTPQRCSSIKISLSFWLHFTYTKLSLDSPVLPCSFSETAHNTSFTFLPLSFFFSTRLQGLPCRLSTILTKLCCFISVSSRHHLSSFNSHLFF